MKNKMIFIVLGLMIVSLFLVFKINSGAKTIEAAIKESDSGQISIIHEEKTDKGSIVFYKHEGMDEFDACFVKKNIFGYRYVYGGKGSTQVEAYKFGISRIYLPNIEKTSFPIYFGIIGNLDIQQVKIVEKKRNIEGQAKIIKTKSIRIWFMYMNKFQGSDFEIIGISSDGKELSKIKDNIEPYYADQKPLKNTTK